MNYDEFEEKTRGVLDLNDVSGCQSAIKALLRDLSIARINEQKAKLLLKDLAHAVRTNTLKADELAGAVLKGTKKGVMEVLHGMSEETLRASSLPDEDLVQDVLRLVWDELEMDGRPSAVLDELVQRFKARPETTSGIGTLRRNDGATGEPQ